MLEPEASVLLEATELWNDSAHFPGGFGRIRKTHGLWIQPLRIKTCRKPSLQRTPTACISTLRT